MEDNAAPADVTELFGTSRIEYRDPEPEPKAHWLRRLRRSQCEQSEPKPPRNLARFAELPSTVLELTGITAVSTGLYQIAPPVGWIGTGLMLIVMGVATSPRTAATVAARRAAAAVPKGRS